MSYPVILSEPMRVDGIDYTSAGIKQLHLDLIPLRDKALKDNDFDGALKVSHALALLYYLADIQDQREAGYH